MSKKFEYNPVVDRCFAYIHNIIDRAFDEDLEKIPAERVVEDIEKVLSIIKMEIAKNENI